MQQTAEEHATDDTIDVMTWKMLLIGNKNLWEKYLWYFQHETFPHNISFFHFPSSAAIQNKHENILVELNFEFYLIKNSWDDDIVWWMDVGWTMDGIAIINSRGILQEFKWGNGNAKMLKIRMTRNQNGYSTKALFHFAYAPI